MVDYIELTKVLHNDNVFLENLQHDASYQSGWDKYLLPGCRDLDVWYKPTASLIRIKGSFAYFYKGHNFSFSEQEFVEAINVINGILNIDLYDAVVDCFEFGTIIQVDNLPKYYIQNHREKPKSGLYKYDNPKDKGNFRRWESPKIRLKMYDAGKNIKTKQGQNMRQIIQAEGWNPEGNYLKLEVHYKKPEVCLNRGRRMLLADLVNPNYNKNFRSDLYNQYKRIMPMGKIKIPNNKKDLSTSNLLLMTLADAKLDEGNTFQEVKRMLFDKVNSIPEEGLTNADKKARKRQISSLMGKIHVCGESKWDLSEQLKAALKLEELVPP
jgi:hypothetical protein